MTAGDHVEQRVSGDHTADVPDDVMHVRPVWCNRGRQLLNSMFNGANGLSTRSELSDLVDVPAPYSRSAHDIAENQVHREHVLVEVQV